MSADGFIFKYFSQKGAIPGSTQEERKACNYIVEGLIDSLGVVELITELEKEFHIHFEYEDLENPRFKTLGGLIEITNSRIKR